MSRSLKYTIKKLKQALNVALQAKALLNFLAAFLALDITAPLELAFTLNSSKEGFGLVTTVTA